jgi:beta-galactosidase beta subunit
MQHIILRLVGKNKKEEEIDLCHENVEKIPFYKKYTYVYYVHLHERIDVIFKRRRKTATTIELDAHCCCFLEKDEKKLLKLSSFRHIIVKL